MNPKPGPLRRREWLRRGLLRLPLLGAAAPAALGLAGCGLSASAPRQDFHALRDASAVSGATDSSSSTPVAAAPRSDKVLLLASGTLPGLYDSDRMVFSADGQSRSYFQYGYWSERPALTLLLLAEARFARAMHFREVALSTSGVRGDLLLTLRLDELYLDAALQPGQVRLLLSAELIDWQARRLLARRGFSRSATVATRDAAGLAQAASQAVGVALGELVSWAAASAAAPTTPAA